MRTRSRANVASNETGNQAKSKAKIEKKSTPITEHPLDKEEDKLTKGKRKATKLNHQENQDDQEKSNAKIKKSTTTQSSQTGSRKKTKTHNEKASVLQETKEKQDVESSSEVESESKGESKPSKATKSTRKTKSKIASKTATKGTTKSSPKGKKVTTVKKDTKKEVKEETQNETLETSKLSRSTRGKNAASAAAVSKPASRSRATKQTSPKKAEANDSSQSTQSSLDEEAFKTNASNKSSSKSKTSKKAASHKLTKESESIKPTRSSKSRSSTQVKTKPSQVKETSVTDVKSARASKKATPSKFESSSGSETSTGRKTRSSKRVATETFINVDQPKTKKQKQAPKPKPEKVEKSEPITKSTKTRGKRGGKKDEKESEEKEKIKEMEIDEEEIEGVSRLSTVPEESEEEDYHEMVEESKSSKHTEENSQKILKPGQEILKASTKEILPTVVDVLESIKDKLETTLECEMRQDNEKRQERENNSTLDDDETSMDANVDQDSIQGTFEEEKIINGELKKKGTTKRPKGTVIERKDIDYLSSSSDSNLENKMDYESETLCSKRKSSEVEEDIQVKDKLIKKAKLEVTEPDSAVGGHLMTFGDDICGELGQKVIGLSKKRPVLVEGINDKVNYIAVGAMHNVCITSKNQVYTFGCNDEGALGRDTSSDSNLESKPLKVPISVKVNKVTAGDSHTAALTSLGGVYLWGNFKDPNGSIGLTPDSPGSEIHPIHIPTFNMTFVDIASGGDHLLLLSDAGKVYSLGVGEQGQLGRFKPEEVKYTKDRKSLYLSPNPVQFSEEVECDRVWAGNYSSFARSKDGKVYSWGLNNYSQLGYKTSENELIVPYPKCITKFSEIGCTIEDICAGQHHSISRDSNGRVYSFGRNEYGRLGHGQTGHDEDVPRMIESLKEENIINIATGSVCSFAISDRGHLYAWGMGAPQLGIGDGDLWEPTRVVSSVLEKSRVLKVSSGAQHTAIIVDFENAERNRK